MTVKFDSFFTLATREGMYPTMPVQSSQKCYGHMEISKRYKPDAEWMVFEVRQMVETTEGVSRLLDLEVSNRIQDDVKETLIAQLKHRFGLEQGVRI